MLCAALVAAASILALPPLTVGPEKSVPSAADAPVQSTKVDVASDGRDYVVTWTGADAVFAQKIDGTTGARVGNVPKALVTGTASRSAARIASNGNGYMVAWTEGQKITTASVDANGTVISTQVAVVGDHVSSPSQLSLAPSGSGYLLVWLEDAGSNPAQQRIAGIYVDGSGKAVGGPMEVTGGVSPVSALSIASHSSTSAVTAIVSGGTVQSWIIQPGAKGPDPIVLSTSAGPTSLLSFWDGSAFDIAWTIASNQAVLAVIDEGGALARAPEVMNGTMILDAVATNPGGSALFGHSFAPLMVRLGRGGNAVDTSPRPLPSGINIPVSAAAGANGSYLLVLSTPDLVAARTTLSDSPVTVNTIALTQPPQGMPRIAAGDTTQFVGWLDTRRTDSRDVMVGRFRNGSFVDAGMTIGRGDSFGMAASHDTAAIASMAIGSPALVTARFVDANGTVSQPM